LNVAPAQFDSCQYSQKIHLGIYLEKQMKTIQVDRHGNADVLELTEIETPKPQAGKALVKHLGAFVMGTTSNETKAQRVLDLGADAAIDYTQEDFVKRVKELVAFGDDLIISE
jgi:NADPH:quinone reductase-like Zn-dependent oxidoreductase